MDFVLFIQFRYEYCGLLAYNVVYFLADGVQVWPAGWVNKEKYLKIISFHFMFVCMSD